MKEALSISRNDALRWGNAGLIATLSGSLALVVLIAAKAPDLILLLPVTLMAICLGVILFTRPRLNFIVWLGGLALLFSSEPGLQIHEVLYGLYFYAYLGHWYLRRLFLYRKPIVHGRLDVAIALWLGLGLTLGTGLGLLFGTDLTSIRGEAIAVSMIAIYFPIKEFCMREKHGSVILLAILAFIGVWVTVDNALAALQTIQTATELWQIEIVRKAGRELLLVFAGILSLSVLPTLRKRTHQVGVAFVLAALLGGLILAKSRAYWVEYLVAVVALIVITSGVERKRLLAWCVAGTCILSLVGILFLSSYVNLFIVGISSRFATIGAASADLSFLNRFTEASAVLEKVGKNPILGYGFATNFSFFDIIALKTRTRGYVHIGFVAVLYKFGLWGSLLIAFAWLSSLVTTFCDSRRRAISAFDQAVLRGIFVCSASAVLPAITSSVFFESDKLSAFIYVTALATGLHFKYKNRTGSNGARLQE